MSEEVCYTVPMREEVTRLERHFNITVACAQEKGRYVYFYQQQNASITDIAISQEEALALRHARQLLQSLPFTKFYQKALQGLDSLLEKTERHFVPEASRLENKIIIANDLARHYPRWDCSPIEDTLAEALEKNLPLRLTLPKSADRADVTTKKVYPVLFVSYLGTWHILGIEDAHRDDGLDFQLPQQLSDDDFVLIHYFDILEMKILAHSKQRYLPEYYLQNQGMETCGGCPAQIIYDEANVPILRFGFWFMGYRVELEFQEDAQTGEIVQLHRNPPPLPYGNVHRLGQDHFPDTAGADVQFPPEVLI